MRFAALLLKCPAAFFIVIALRATALADSFRENVAPIFEKRCVSCHNAAESKGGLNLTSRSGLLKGGESGPSVVPGKLDESPLLEMVVGDPPEMPRKGTRLTKAEVGELRKWIETGASWPDGVVLVDRKFEGETWWAFAPLVRPSVPVVSSSHLVRNPIDGFVLAKLTSEQLEPSPEASRRILIRRLTFDLLGLPPSPEDVEAFERDRALDAYERLVDRLLASPHYGERWGRHWLDVAHYGDTHGYDKDKRRDYAWPYRDWVIRAFNSDLPYGSFVRKQIAGDVLSPDEPDGVIATGFIAAGPWDFVGHAELREGTVDKAKARLIDRDDMVASTIATFQSLTAHCARCHDHKFDPIPQKDYYRLQAVFAGVDRGNRFYTSRNQIDKRKALEARRAQINARLEAIAKEIAAKKDPIQARLEDEIIAIREKAIDAARPPSTGTSPTNGYHSAIHPRAEAQAWVQVDLGSKLPIDEIHLVPARPTDFPDTPGFGFPSTFKVEVSDDPAFPAGQTKIVDSEARPDTPNVPDEPYVIRPKDVSGRYVRVSASRLWKRQNDYVFALAELEVISGGTNVALEKPVSALDSTEVGRWSKKALVDGFDSRGKRPDVKAGASWHGLLYERREFDRLRDERAKALISPEQSKERDKLKAEREEIDAELAGLKSTEQVYAPIPQSPRPIQVLKRGEVEQPGETVGPGALSCVPGVDALFADTEDEGARRAALAEWLASSKNVLTWRSIANRVWSYHFGKGLVDTPNDFGRNGSKPSHPELLDFLATELRDNGESIKKLHKLIVTSATYRQNSASRPEATKKDADNRWLWRQNRRRLEAEAVRDSVLSVTGTLSPTMYGPGFDLFRFKDDHSPIYDHTAPGVSDHAKVRRRTVYRFTVRSVPNPFLECLDAPDPSINVPTRTTTITALQALALWNDRFIESQAEEFAKRLEKEATGLESRVDLAYRLCLGRVAGEEELADFVAYAKGFGLAGACRILMNSNEFIFVD